MSNENEKDLQLDLFDKGKVLLNGREVTEDELQRQREAIKKQKGARLVEVSENNFRLRLDD
jgi:biopolymer transport protein ExbD